MQPGLNVLTPATLEDAREMLAPGRADPDPVLVFEQIELCGVSWELADDAGPVANTGAAVRRAGVTIAVVRTSARPAAGASTRTTTPA